MSKTFTVVEAQRLVPVLDALLRRAREAAVRSSEFDTKMQALHQRIFFSGGLHVDVPAAARTRAEHDKAVQQARTILEEIEEIGAQIQDFEQGVLELPHTVEGRTVQLCWTLGEPEIAYWREQEDALEVRRALDGRFNRERLQ